MGTLSDRRLNRIWHPDSLKKLTAGNFWLNSQHARSLQTQTLSQLHASVVLISDYSQLQVDKHAQRTTNWWSLFAEHSSQLKWLAEAKIIKKSVILFRLLNMTIWCKHVHRLELQKFCNFCAAHLPVRLDIETKFPISYFGQPCQK